MLFSHLESTISKHFVKDLLLDALGPSLNSLSTLESLAEMEQDIMVLPPRPVFPTCLLCVEKLQPKNKFNQRSEKMQKQRKAVRQDKIKIVQSVSQVKDF